MAKKNDTSKESIKAKTQARIRRTEAYAEKVRALFASTVNEILALNKSMPVLGEGEMFSFDNTSLKKQKEVERLLRQLHSVATMAIQQGIRLEWAQANAECDKLVQSCFGKRALNTPEFTAFTQRNEAAMAAFIARSEKGLNLSQRVWRSCRQLRDEMEVAITVAVGDGTSAATMSRQVRQYLNDPDLMFRRFRYKAGEEIEYDEDGNEIGKKIIWGKKWKKKIRKPDGSVGWIDYDKDSYHDEWTGPGYYKSSAQNAMRVARTETNIAYRRADNERWQQMDFVLGQRVQLSGNHPAKDICDKLAGDYPPDFVFDGWHPQCFCFVTPILIDEDEIVKMNEAMLNGEEYKPRGKRITQYPENFKEWVRDNKEKLLEAHDYGSDPYFVRNNFTAIQDILNPKKQMSILERAEQRHANRTPEDIEKIKLAWAERNAKIESARVLKERTNNTANNVLNVASTRFKDFNIDTTALNAAMKSGDTTLIQAETRALAQQLAQKQKQIKTTANNVLGVASKYKDLDGSPYMTSLNDIMKSGDLSAINAETRALASRIASIRQELKNMSSVIPNAQQWADQFTMTELQATHDAVENTINTWLKKHGYKDWDSAPLAHKEAKLIQEINAVVSSKKYATWEVSEKAYQAKLAEVQEAIAFEEFNKKLSEHKSYYLTEAKKFTSYKNLITQLEAAIKSKDKATAQILVSQLDMKKAEIQAKKAASSSSTSKITVPKSTNNTPQKAHLPSGMTMSEKLNEIKKQTGITDDAEARAYYDAVFGFSYQWDYEIREVQCGRPVTSYHGHTQAEIEQRAQNLENFIAKSPQWKGSTTYRGMSLSPMEIDNIRNQLKSGICDMQGSASWSTTETVSRGFATAHINEKSKKFGDIKNTPVVLVTTTHKKATSIKYLSRFVNEDEVLASMGCRYKFVKEEMRGSYLYFFVEAV